MSLKRSLNENYFSFSGRASRSEYWKLKLLYMAINAVLVGFIWSFGISMASPNAIGGAAFIVMLFVSAYFFIPLISVSIRRLHDLGLSGRWLLAPVVVAALFFLGGHESFLWSAAAIIMTNCWGIVMCARGTRGDNVYGPNPVDLQ